MRRPVAFKLVALCAVVGIDLYSHPATGQARLELAAGLVTHVGHIVNVGWSGDGPSFGGGVRFQAVAWTGSIYALGLEFGELWLTPPTGSSEIKAEQRDFLLMNKFSVASWDALDLVIDLGLGVSWYLDEADVPPSSFGPGGRHRYEMVSPAVHAGVEAALRVHPNVSLQAGIRLAGAFPLPCSEDSYCYPPGWLGINLHGGLSVSLP